MLYSIAKRYTQALFDLSQEAGERDSISHDLKKIQELISRSEEFNTFLHNPVIPLEKRQEILEIILNTKVSTLMCKFIDFLNVKNRLNLLEGVCQVFEQLHLDANGVLRVKITSSVTLDSRQVKEISKHLKLRLNKDIEPYCDDDPSLLGGLKIQEGDTIYDYSLRTQLEQFKKNLIKA